MDQTTIQTILEGGILVTLVWIGSSTASIAKHHTSTGGSGTGPQGDPDDPPKKPKGK